MPQNSNTGPGSQKPATSKKFNDADELQNLTHKVEEQKLFIEELTLIQQILSTMCHVSLYQVNIFEAKRNLKEEITGYSIQKVNPNGNEFKIEKKQTEEINEEIINLFSRSGESETSEYEFSLTDENNKQRWFLNKLAVFKRTESGLPQQVMVITQDITEKKSIELASLENQYIIKSVTDASPDILFILSLPDLAMVYTNKAVNDILHYSPGQIMEMGGSFTENNTHPEDKEKILNYFASVSNQKNYPLRELHYRMKDALGDWHHIRCRHSVYKTDENGLPLQLIGVRQDITEYKKVVETRIKTKMKRQKDISSAILQTQEEERKRIAEALHNSLGQVLYGARLNLNRLDPDKSNMNKNNAEIKKIIGDLLDDAIKETKTISFELMPATLEDFGLETAIKDILRNKLEKTAIKYSVYISGLKNRLAPEIEIAIFRIVQELINNLIKHARASQAEVNVNRGSDYIIIKITDNGTGFSAGSMNTKGNGFGLRSIINRVKFLNGNINFDSDNGQGSIVTIDIPL